MKLSEIIPRLETLPARTRSALVDLPALQFVRLPPRGGWSIAQVFEHLCMTNSAYLDHTIPDAVERAKQSRHGARQWRTSLVGGLLIASMRESSSRRLPAPGPLRVGDAVRPDVVQVFLARLPELEGHIHALEGVDQRISIASPIARWVHMNVGDACVILVEHAHRHLAQVERIRREVEG